MGRQEEDESGLCINFLGGDYYEKNTENYRSYADTVAPCYFRL